jgi:PilZ domain-containing protein
VTSLEGHPCCREHFIRSAYGLLDQASTRLEHAAFHGPEAESVMRALDECMRATTNLAFALENPQNLERAQLMDILLWASELCRRMRRGPRKGIAIPIVLRSDVAGRSWREDVVTSTLSRHGGCVFCQHEALYGDVLQVRRKDTAHEAAARVVWVRRMTNESFEIGFELLDQDNYWRLDWSHGNL